MCKAVRRPSLGSDLGPIDGVLERDTRPRESRLNPSSSPRSRVSISTESRRIPTKTDRAGAARRPRRSSRSPAERSTASRLRRGSRLRGETRFPSDSARRRFFFLVFFVCRCCCCCVCVSARSRKREKNGVFPSCIARAASPAGVAVEFRHLCAESLSVGKEDKKSPNSPREREREREREKALGVLPRARAASLSISLSREREKCRGPFAI